MKKINEVIEKKYNSDVKVLQFGEGNFLRAFVDWMLYKMKEAKVFDGSVAVVQPIEFGMVDKLQEQNGLYTVCTEGIKDGKPFSESAVIDMISDFINPYTQYERYLAYAESDSLEIIFSNTTEAGIVLDEDDIDFTKTPTTFPAKLLAFLLHRYNHFNGDMSKGLHIVPCELIDNNGVELKNVLVKLAQVTNQDKKFMNWLENANTYTSTLVDRIVSGYPRNTIEEIQNEIGYEDNLYCKCELFHLFVLTQNDKLQKVFDPQKAGLNVLFEKDIKPFKEQKVKLLNGAHTFMVPIGYLYQVDTVLEVMTNDELSSLVKRFMFEEVVPTINLDKGMVEGYANSVIERFTNPFIRHELISISLNSTTKYLTRILPSVLDYYNKENKLPKLSLFALASLIVFFKGDRNGTTIALKDDQVFLDKWSSLWTDHNNNKITTTHLVSDVLSWEHWGTDLSKIDGFVDNVSIFVDLILTKGMKEAVKTL